MYIILLFAHKNADYKAHTHLLSPKTPWSLLSSLKYSKTGSGERMAVHTAKALNSEEAAQKVGFVPR
jgi:hypothetical protein